MKKGNEKQPFLIWNQKTIVEKICTAEKYLINFTRFINFLSFFSQLFHRTKVVWMTNWMPNQLCCLCFPKLNYAGMARWRIAPENCAFNSSILCPNIGFTSSYTKEKFNLQLISICSCCQNQIGKKLIESTEC